MPEAIRVLYIDDDAALGRLMERTLARHGMAIDWVAGVRRAWTSCGVPAST